MTQENTTVLSLEGIGKSFSGVTVLSNVSFSAAAGRALAIVGENGAGKSTLKNIICGLIQPDSGTLKFLGRELSHFSPGLARKLYGCIGCGGRRSNWVVLGEPLAEYF